MNAAQTLIILTSLAVAATVEAGGTIAGCANEIPLGLTAIEELRHDDGGGPDYLVTAGYNANQQTEVVHANRYAVGGGTLITHICIYTENPDPINPGAQSMILFIAHGDDNGFNDVRPGSTVWSSMETIEVGWQLVELDAPVAASSITWIGAKFPTATATNPHMGINTATDYLPDGVTPTPHQSFVGIINNAGGQDVWTDYEDVPSQAFQGHRAIIRGLHIDVADCSDAGIVVDASGSLETTEGGGEVQFSVSLSGPTPTNAVVVLVSSSDETEGVADTFSLLFDPGNEGIPQVVTVTGQDDAIVDGDVPFSITLLASSLDACYHQLQTVVPIVNLDDDGPACPEDVNGDGLVDVDDLLQVILDWGGGSPSSDINQDGVVDVDDLLAVVLAWGFC